MSHATNIGDAVLDHYRAHWGEPSNGRWFRRFRRTPDTGEVRVFKWDQHANREGVVLYATVGASAEPAVGDDPNHRSEFFVGLLPERDDIADPLAALAMYQVDRGVALGDGHTVPSDSPLWPGGSMSILLVVRPVEEILPVLKLPGGPHVDFLQAIPIFDVERDYKTRFGAHELMKVWQRKQVAFWDPDRRAAAD